LLKLLFGRTIDLDLRFNLLTMVMVEAQGIIDLGEGEVGIDLFLNPLGGVAIFEPADDQPDGDPSAFDNRSSSTDSLHSDYMRMFRLYDSHIQPNYNVGCLLSQGLFKKQGPPGLEPGGPIVSVR
jgi:hypothetical protein